MPTCMNIIFLLVFILAHGGNILHRIEAGGEHKKKEEQKNHGNTSRPRAIVHIGPHKTGTTHVQAYLKDNAALLEKNGFYFPKDSTTGEYFDVKTAANFGHYLRGVDNISAAIRTTTSAMKDFLYSRGMKGHNVIFSVENLCTLDPAQVKAFHAMLTKGSGLEQLVADTNGISANTQIFHGFDVTIVVTYREFLSHFRSHYAGISLNVEVPTAPFLQAIFKEAGKAQFSLNHIIASYAHFFGLQNVVILDYYGMSVAKKDPAYVILCEVAGILCTEAARLNKSAKRENASKDWLPRQLLDVFKAHVSANAGCSLPSHVHSEVLSIFRRNLTAAGGRKPPYQRVMLEPLYTQSNQYDTILRSRYGQRILYGNVTANREAQREVQVEELLYWRIYEDPYWKNWLHSQFAELRSRKLVTGCSA